MRLDELRQGDVLLFHGDGPVSKIMHVLDDCPYDHAALVVDAGGDPNAMDVAGVGVRAPYPVADYVCQADQVNRENVTACLVLRHRLARCGRSAAHEALRLRGAGITYDHRRLVYLAFLAIARWGPLTVDQRRMLVSYLTGAVQKVTAPPAPPATLAMICADFVFRSMLVEDICGDADAGSVKPYHYGLVEPKRSTSSLVRWLSTPLTLDGYAERFGGDPNADVGTRDLEPDDLMVPPAAEAVRTSIDELAALIAALPALDGVERPGDVAADGPDADLRSEVELLRAWVLKFLGTSYFRAGLGYSPWHVWRTPTLYRVGTLDTDQLRTPAGCP